MHRTRVGEVLFVHGDLTRIYRLNYWTYVCTGLWEYPSAKQWKTRLYKLYHSLVVSLYLFCILSYLGDAVSVRHDLDKLSFNMSSNVLILITFFKVTLLKMQSTDVNKLLTNLEKNLNLKTTEHSTDVKEILRKRAKVILKIHHVLYSLLFVSFILRIMADTAFDTKAYLIPLPFKLNLESHYKIIYAQQVIVSLHFLVTVLAHDLLIYGIINRFIAHFEILEKNFLVIGRLYPTVDLDKCMEGHADGCRQDIDVLLRNRSLTKTVEINLRHKLKAAKEEATEREAGQMLKENIAHHQELLKEIMNFTRIYSSSFIVQASAAVFITGIVAIKILLLSSQITPLLIQQIVYIGINLINNLFLCSLGSDLTSKSVAAADALYGIPWFEMGPENRRTVSIAVKKLLAGAKLKGGGLVDINRRTYLKFLQTSYNMIVLLRNLYRS